MILRCPKQCADQGSTLIKALWRPAWLNYSFFHSTDGSMNWLWIDWYTDLSRIGNYLQVWSTEKTNCLRHKSAKKFKWSDQGNDSDFEVTETLTRILTIQWPKQWRCTDITWTVTLNWLVQGPLWPTTSFYIIFLSSSQSWGQRSSSKWSESNIWTPNKLILFPKASEFFILLHNSSTNQYLI